MHENDPNTSPAPPPLQNPYQAPRSHEPQSYLATGPSEEDKSLGMLSHLLAIFTGFLGPLILWLVKKDSSAFVAHHAREALNFQITLLLVMMALGGLTLALMLILVGVLLIPLLFIVPIFALVVEILAAVAAQKGEWYRYPCCLRLV